MSVVAFDNPPTPKRTDIFRMYVPKVEFRSATPFFQQSAAQVKALANFPEVLSVKVDPNLCFRNIWGYIMSDLSQTVIMNDLDLIAYMDGVVVYQQKLWRLSTITGTFVTSPIFYSGFATFIANNPGATNECLFVTLALGGFYFHPVRLNITADTFTLRVNDLRDTGPARYDGQLFVRSQIGV